MSKPPFQFKQFNVAQSKCAVKINTDGVLLGAWANTDGANHILDIGTGTGVIALMMAQRNARAQIHAIDIDEGAYLQAKENFEQSKWGDRLIAYHTPLQSFEAALRYDLVISNPPYFVDDFKTGNHRKNIAKHSVALSYTDLLQSIARLLDAGGKAMVVLPAFNLQLFEREAGLYQLYVTRVTEVTAVTGKEPYLVLLQIERLSKPLSKSSLTIQNGDGNFTDEYKLLTKDFYLKF